MSPVAIPDIGADSPLRYAAPPAEVRVIDHGRVLELVWQERAAQSLGASGLRTLCRCAECMSARRREQFRDIDPDVVIADVQPCGAGALNLHFSDGHRRGIFPFAWLASLSDDPTTNTAAP